MAERKSIVPQGIAPNPALSPGVQVGEFLFISGNVAQDGNGNLVGAGDCEAQSRQVMSNIGAIAAAAGASMADVVKITCFLTDIANYAAYGKVRSETFPSNPPASSTVIVAGLVRPEYLVEVEAVVHVSSG
jgi:reactive intermediate/imine deaminase